MIRWLKKATGEMVLQERASASYGSSGTLPPSWQDIPTEVEKPEPKAAREWYIEPPHEKKPGRSFALQGDPMRMIMYSGDAPSWLNLIRVREILDDDK